MKINAGQRLRSHRVVDSWYKDGNRTPIESAVVPEVAQALKDWATHAKNCVLIGGLAVSYYGRARATMDVDMLFLSPEAIPSEAEVPGFRRKRAHAFQHNRTHVEIEVLDPQFLKLSPALAVKIFETSVECGALHVASREGLIASKLDRFSLQDQADIEHVWKPELDFSGWPLSEKQRQNLARFSKP